MGCNQEKCGCISYVDAEGYTRIDLQGRCDKHTMSDDWEIMNDNGYPVHIFHRIRVLPPLVTKEGV